MGYTSPKVWESGDKPSASELNQYLSDNIAYLKALLDTAIQRGGAIAFTGNQPMGGYKLTGLAVGSAPGDSVRYDELLALTSPFSHYRQAIPLGISHSGFTQTIDAGGSITLQGVAVRLLTGNDGTDTYFTPVATVLPTNVLVTGKLVRAEWVVRHAAAVASQYVRLYVTTDNATIPASDNASHFGFKINGQDICYSHANGTNESTADTLVDLTTTAQLIKLRVDWLIGTSLNYYVNNVLVNGPITAYMPSAAAAFYLLCGITAVGANARDIYLGNQVTIDVEV